MIGPNDIIMVQIQQIVEQLRSRVNPSLDSHAAFLNYLAVHEELTLDWSFGVLNRFYRECLVYPHWQQNKSRLKEQTRQLLTSIQQAHLWDLELEKVQWVDEVQVITLERWQDRKEVIERHFKQKLYHQQPIEIRFINDQRRLMAIIFNKSNQQIHMYGIEDKFILNQGLLEPLTGLSGLRFDQELNLIEGGWFTLELGSFILSKFRTIKGLYDYRATRGYLFQKFQSFTKAPLETIPKLFYPLKRLENYFIKKESNPYYVGLSQELERTIELLRMREPLDKGYITDLIIRVRNAIEYVFVSDKLLHLYIKELEEQGGGVQLKSENSFRNNLANSDLKESWHLGNHDFIDNKQEQDLNRLPPQELKKDILWPSLKTEDLFDLTDSLLNQESAQEGPPIA